MKQSESSAAQGVSNDTSDKFAVFSIAENLFAVPVGPIEEMQVLGEVTPLADAPAHVRGVVRLRGRVVPVFDTRNCLGVTTIPEEVAAFDEMLAAREEDHRRWLEELEASVQEGRSFRLATDPHKCRFGIWYDQYEAPNLLLENHLKRFDAPHKAIHGLARRVEELVREDSKEAALTLIEKTRTTTLARMIELFGETKQLLRSSMREIALVWRFTNGQLVAFSVDRIVTVDALDLSGGVNVPELSPEVSQAAFWGPERKLVLVVDMSRLSSGEALELAAA